MITTDRPVEPRLPSPLDPFLLPFLQRVGDHADGYSPLSHGTAIANALGWPPAFVEGLYASARAQGLLEPFRARGARGRNRWRLSRRGSALLAAYTPDGSSRTT